MRPTRWTVGVLWVAGLLLWAPGPTHGADVFNACSNNTTNKVRAASVLANGVPMCKSTEAPRTWAQTGPAGPAGPSDAFSTYQEIGDARGPIPVPRSSSVIVGTLTLPAGSYVVTASLYFTNGSPDAGIAYCTLLVGDRNAQVIDSEAGGQAVSQALTVASQLINPGTATLTCTNNGAAGSLAIQTFNLNAIKVGHLS